MQIPIIYWQLTNADSVLLIERYFLNKGENGYFKKFREAEKSANVVCAAQLVSI